MVNGKPYELYPYDAGEEEEMADTRVWKLRGVKEGDTHDQGIVAAKSCRMLIVAFYNSQKMRKEYDEDVGDYIEQFGQDAKNVA